MTGRALRPLPLGPATLVLLGLLAACAPVPGSSADAPAGSAVPSAAVSAPAPASAADGSPIDIDLAVIREALIGPSPVPAGWEEQVDEIIASLEEALADLRLPAVDGLPAEEAACATWEPLVGKQTWATGALLERQVFIAHLGQLANVAPDEIRADAQRALDISAAAAAEQLRPGGDPAVVSRAPRDELGRIGRWAVEHCTLPITADPDPDTEGWSEEDLAASCKLDRSLLERGMEDFRDGPGDGRYPTHPHEIEVSLDVGIYPAWHHIAEVDNDADPPTFRVEPIPGAFCDR